MTKVWGYDRSIFQTNNFDCRIVDTSIDIKYRGCYKVRFLGPWRL